jgi:hypothetical protein
MASWFLPLLDLLGTVMKRDTRICMKCHAFEGEIMCDRSLLGEPGACRFAALTPCTRCGSKVPCFGLPCELAERMGQIRANRPAER